MKTRFAFLLLGIVLTTLNSFGQELITSARYPFSTMGVGSEMAIADPLYAEESPAANYKVDRRFRVELNYNRNNHTDLISGNFWTLSVTVNNPSTGQNEVLLLEHTATGNGTYAAWADFTGTGTSMGWKITAITVQKWNGSSWIAGTLTDLPAQDIHLEAMVFNDRIVNMSATPAKMSLTGTPGNVLNWTAVPGAVEYDVEWVFISEFDNFTYNSSVPAGPFDFKESVRITTFRHQHQLDLIYPKGTLYFRVRPRGYYFRSNSDKEIYYQGSWSYAKKSGSGNMLLAVTTDFEAQKNWQYTVAYAENGLSMSQVTYFDGTLRARQQLSQMKSTGQVVAAATLYDYEGRQSIQVIPTPVNTNSLTYYNNLHKDASGGAFEKSDFDVAVPAAMGTSSGAGRYYSSANDLNSDPFRERIPDAEGYPYTQVVYANDNTGRPLRSSGVGYTHRMGGGHETNYYYVKPTERELRELFGSNVGNVSHYDKQVVLDPNGQATVTYTDQFGRVIASGLYGSNPSSLLPLDNNPDGSTATVTSSLLSGNSVSTDANGNLQSVTDYYHLNFGTNDITLSYDLLSGALNSFDAYFGVSGCASCFYELEIQVFDPNGNQVNLGYTSVTAPGAYPNSIFERYAASQLNCASGIFDPSLALISKVVSLTQSGEYHIRKILRVDQQAVANYLATNAATLPGAPSLAALTAQYQSNAIVTGCGFDCKAFYEQECREDNGFPLTGNLTPAQQVVVDTCIASKCETAVSDIENTTDPEADQCNMILGTLKQDVSPGGWVLEDDISWRSTTSNWDFNYTKSDNSAFNPTSFADLLANWDVRFADSLVKRHPEYCQYKKCTTLTVINDYIVTVNNVSTWNSAVLGGYINSAGNFLPTNDPLNTHPLYASTFSGFVTGMNANYNNTGQTPLQVVNTMITNNPDLAEDANGQLLTYDALNDRKWMLLRSLYLGLRQDYIEDNYPNCNYYNHPSANFTDPDQIQSDANSTPAFDNFPNGDCPSICEQNVTYWMGRIQAECASLTATDLQTIQMNLQNYCLADCDGLDNEFGAIQISDLIAGNSNLMAVNAILETACTFDLYSFAEDDTCANPVTVNVNNVDVFPANLVQNLAVLTSVKASGFGQFITLPKVMTVPNYTQEFTQNYWNAGMNIQLINTTPPTSVNYSIASIASIVVTNQTVTGTTITFTVKVTKTDGIENFHTINQFNLTKAKGGTATFPIDSIKVKTSANYSYCDPNTAQWEVNFSLENWVNDCVSEIQEEATTLAELQYAAQMEAFLNGLTSSFSSQCFGTGLAEQFYITYKKKEYAFTLYYYDQAGNLVQTVPPQGVHIVPASGFNAQGAWLNIEPAHLMKTMYTYNSLNQMVKSETPDGGIAKFWYNSAQQLRFSQNAVQQTQNKYSYTKFDALGRSLEAGVFTEATQATALNAANDNTYPLAGTYTLNEVVRTFYHKQTLVLNTALDWNPGNLNNRVAAVAYYETMTSVNPAYTNAMFYDYDIHGNVKRMLTDHNYSYFRQDRYKTVDYNYDLYSGKVLEVVYQATKEDQFIHRYTYDDDNRITGVMTSRDGVQWDEDASYYYYLHGPLARMELGDQKVQGIDYAYTVHGWLKGVNDNTLTARRDLGKDGAAQLKSNRWVARDAFGYSLTYFNQGLETDYKPIVTPTDDVNWLATNESAIMTSASDNLYNGNIRMMVTAIAGTNNLSIGTVARKYKYDQLQRLKQAKTYTAATLESANSWTGAAANNSHQSDYSYDLNGNITHLTRRGNSAVVDDLSYVYYDNNLNSLSNVNTVPSKGNRLANVQDTPGSAAAFADDIDPAQATDNYRYDALGRLIWDKQEKIASITWNVQNKVTKITRDAGNTLPDVEFFYNAMGQRIMKIVYPKNANGSINTAQISSTYYALDASGNVMATYKQTGSSPTSTQLQDFELYGSVRLGTQIANQTLSGTQNFNYCSKDNRASAIVELKSSTFTNGQTVQYRVGTTVLNTAVTWTGTIENNVNALMTTINNNTTATDVAARLWHSNNASGTFYLQLYYTQPGNWKGQSLNVYVNGATNNASIKRAMGYGTSKGNDIVGSKRYELANHLGNVLSVITDRKWAVDDGIFNTTTGIKTSSTFDGLADYYVATIVSYSDYDPFGTIQDGRKGSQNGEKYRFGYQGSEKDDEIKGEGNSYTTHYRLLDPRLGRWFSTDPVFQPWQSPYTSMDNNPVRLNDPLGNWTDKKAQKVANKVRKLGGEAAVFNETGKKHDYAVSITKKYGEYTFSGSLGGRGKINSEEKLKSLDWLRCTKALDYTLGNHKRNMAAYEAEKQREYNNEHSIMGQFTGGNLNGWVDKYAFHTQWNNNAFIEQWKRSRANVSSVNTLVKNMLYTTVVIGTGGVVGLELYGSGAGLYVYNLGKEGVRMYGRNFVNGGWQSTGMELVNQTTTQLVQGDWSLGNYDLLGIATSGALGGKYGGLQWQMIQGASGGVASFTIKDGFQSPVFQKSSNYTICTTLIGTLSPLMGEAPIVRGVGEEIVNEVVTGATQGVVEKVQPTK